jgi:hypothetical protein
MAVSAGETLPALHYGQNIELDAKVRPPRNFGNPGAFDYRRFLARQPFMNQPVKIRQRLWRLGLPRTTVMRTRERDPNLLEKLRAEWPGIMAWAVRGCIEWHRNGMQTPAEVRAATDEYHAESCCGRAGSGVA